MEKRYRLLLFNHSVYKEIEISPDTEPFIAGNVPAADVRFRRDLFFEGLELHFDRYDEEWTVSGPDNLYLDAGDGLKRVSLPLRHGTRARICYRRNENEALRLEFDIDFDYGRKRYDRRIDISSSRRITIGGTKGADIVLNDGYVGGDSFVLRRESDSWILQEDNTRYGIGLNGVRVSCGAVIRDLDFFSIAGFSFYYREGNLYTTGENAVVVYNLPEEIREETSTVFDYPHFVRNTRVQYRIPEEEIEIQQPGNKPGLHKQSLLMSLIPTLVMLAMTIILRGVIGGGGTYVIYSAVSMTMGAIMSVITYIQDKKNYEEEIKKREDTYRDYVAQKEEVIARSRVNELRIRRLIQEPLEFSLDEASHFGRRLFEKGPEDPDYLCVYLGSGTVPSANPVKFNLQEMVDTMDPIAQLPETVAERYRYIEEAPIFSDLHTSSGVGVVGTQEALKQILRIMTLDLAIRHFYKEVKLVYLMDEAFSGDFAWVRWLHNVNNEVLDQRNIGCDEESSGILLEYLYAVLSGREAAAKDAQLQENGADTTAEHYVVFVTDPRMIGVYPVSRYFGRSAGYGVTFVFLDEHEENIPRGCSEMIRLYGEQTGEILKTADGDQKLTFRYPVVTAAEAQKTSLQLGAVFVDEVSLEAGLTSNITMFEMLGILSAEDLDLGRRWGESKVYKTMAAPIGVKSRGELISLDLSDKSGGHGPHGLVAGTTGSGKSEILQTYILSAATRFHPYDISFVIIDFKGGGMANQFADLPHLIGTITNIDGREINRSLLSIKAELVKRQEMFSRAGVNHINDYIRLYKDGRAAEPMPHLVIIVDEFAELKADYPDFMKELISAARIGRTLGVHLILATQKPAGVVDSQIWSNSKFRLCLKVQTREDSNEVLKTPLAAEIVEPGRAYFQVGNNEIFELIQSAYSGAPVPRGNSSREQIYSIYEKNLWGKKTLVYTNRKKNRDEEGQSQLDAIVRHVQQYCRENHIDRLPGICLPSLPEHIGVWELDYTASADGFAVPIGLFDDPEQQRQGEVRMDLTRNNVYIVGSSQMGKSILLQTIAYGLIRIYTPQQISLYMIDCGSMMLRNFEESRHVGGVVISGEDEKCRNLFKLLNTFVNDRKKALSEKGVGNYQAYLEVGYTDMPLVVVMIDNMAAFREFYPEQSDQLGSLTREAQGVGISFVITAAASSALNYRTQANFGEKIVLNCNDSSEYSNVFGRCRQTPRENAGRCLIMMDKRILEAQIAMFGQGQKEAERSAELRSYIEEHNASLQGRAVRIPMVPDHLPLDQTMQENAAIFRTPGIVPVGMEFSTVEFNYVDLVENPSLTLLGDAGARQQFLCGFLSVLRQTIIFHNVRAVILDDRKRPIAEAQKYGFVQEYTTDAAEGLNLLSDMMNEAKDAREEEDPEREILLLVLNNAEVSRKVFDDKKLSRELAGELRSAEGQRAFYLFGQIENQPVGFNASDVLKTLKEQRQGILFAPAAENRFYEISGRIRPETSFDRTMGYRFDGGTYKRIRLFEGMPDGLR